jgi:Ca-activated chloride channel family protein
MFRFAEPQYLYLLIFIPILIAVYVWYRADYRRRKRKFAQNEIMQILSPDASNSRARHKFELYLLAVLLLIIAAARPQFGSKLKEEKRTGREIMLAVDVSNSMLAQDI